ncbi:thiosulfate/3-mercaptopyruvate sulfurtransferase [Cytobacillus eiseniae]|uniref:Thiosulfate/3-mercaptopyruvate sulfurtransferase n=1 Tax=Cytobacillus eiseniae TaxID=762947 RepID=A0ABS4REG7_9BACI|nr:sulfurtransferase [Cytobacillus eiseniae]MBP2241296.1 thiosulfate/3-mercaptopyruvate sulfurtransferase [Cytobacillus eiseniae]
MNHVVEKEWLLAHIGDDNIRLADCRYNLGNADEGYQLYLADHIPGAVYFDLEKDLSAPVTLHGGRHPLPDVNKLKLILQKAGISPETTVIAYDGGEGAFAARLWWILNYVGHENVFVLNGGYKEWRAQDYPVEETIQVFNETIYDIEINTAILASYEEVKKKVREKSPNTVIIDSRESKRYLGIEEPIDKKAGHIPGAINKIWTEGLGNGRFKSKEEQYERFSDIDKENEIIVYCGSGVTATPNYLALKEAGFKNVRLYAGSFSDWVSYDENEVETGENHLDRNL